MNDDFTRKIKHWLIENKSSLLETDFDDSTPLIETGILDSMLIVDLILYLEFLTQKPMSIETIKPESFYSINTIVSTFFQQDADSTSIE